MRLISFLAAILVLVAGPLYFQTISQNEKTIDQNTASTVFISVKNSAGAVQMMATGIVIDNQYILSANHVVAAKIGPDQKFYVTFLDGKTQPIEASEHFEDADIGIFKFKNDEHISPAHLSCKTPSVGSKVYTIGNPKGYQWLTSFGFVASGKPLNNGAFDISSVKFWKHGVMLNMSIYPGNSGGGLYDFRTGALIGIISRVLESTATIVNPETGQEVPLFAMSTMDIGSATNAESVCEFLTKNKISYKTI